MGDLRSRALKVLAPYGTDLGLDGDTMRLIVDLTVCYLRQLLETACDRPVTSEGVNQSTAVFMPSIDHKLLLALLSLDQRCHDALREQDEDARHGENAAEHHERLVRDAQLGVVVLA